VEEGARNVEMGRGAGLGLTIARRLARSLGGDLVLASDERGTTATLTVPYARR
jgi:signal transduction histidine kinase